MLRNTGMNPDKPAYPFYSNWFRIVYCRWLVFADRHQTSEVGQRLDMCCGVYMCFFLAPASLCLRCVVWIDFQVYNIRCSCVIIVVWVISPYTKDRSCQHCTVISRTIFNHCISLFELPFETTWLWENLWQQDTALCSKCMADKCLNIRAAQNISYGHCSAHFFCT